MIATLITKIIDNTRKTRVLNIISILAGGALLLVLLLHSRVAHSPLVTATSDYDALISIGGVTIPVTVADTDAEREQGLSGTAYLPQGTGKLFVFDTPRAYGFWMKDMAYSLDIIWIDEDMRVIAISKDIFPESYPEIVYPPANVAYVLEVNSGFSTRHGIRANQLLTFHRELTF
jgi:uncharacterized protein